MATLLVIFKRLMMQFKISLECFNPPPLLHAPFPLHANPPSGLPWAAKQSDGEGEGGLQRALPGRESRRWLCTSPAPLPAPSLPFSSRV